MKTNISNGLNASSLSWDYMITLNRLKPTSLKQWDDEMLRIMIENSFNQIYWSCEKNQGKNSLYHTHLLIDTNNLITDNDLIRYFMRYLKDGKEISYKSKYTSMLDINTARDIDGKKIIYNETTGQNNRVIEYKNTRTLVDINGNKIVSDYYEKEVIPFYEIKGKDGRCYLEKIKGVKNIALYITKFTSTHPSTGYLNQRSIRQSQ